jgi:hypothetical protein
MKKGFLILIVGIGIFAGSAAAQTGPVPLPQGIEGLLDQVLSRAQLDDKFVAVVPLQKIEPDGARRGCANILGRYIAERIGTRLIQRGGQVVERSRLDAALKEMDLNASITFDRTQAMQLGKLVGANFVLTGSMTELVNSVEVDSRLFSTERGLSAGAGFVTLVKDQDILRLIGSGGRDDCASSGNGADAHDPAGANDDTDEDEVPREPSKVLQTDTQGGTRLDLLGCRREGARIVCNARMTMSRAGYNHVVGGVDGSFLWDENGEQYSLSRVKLGANEGGGRAMGDLPAGVPTQVEVVFDGVPEGLRKFSALQIATYQYKFVFKNIPLSR